MNGFVENKYIGYTTPIVIENIHYIMTRLENKRKSLSNIRKLRKMTSILTVDEDIIEDALLHEVVDFEDSRQYITSKKMI